MKRMWLASVALMMLAAAAWGADPSGGAGEKPTKPDVENPIRDISAFMKKAGELLAKLETGDPTQEEQKKALKELDELIKMAEEASSSSQKRQQRQNQNSDGKPQQPQNSTGASSGNVPVGREADILRQINKHLGAEPPDLREMWGRMPAAARDEMMQLLNENLPMKYKTLLILYFKALSEKK